MTHVPAVLTSPPSHFIYVCSPNAFAQLLKWSPATDMVVPWTAGLWGSLCLSCKFQRIIKVLPSMFICDIPTAKANDSFFFAAYRATLRFMTRQRRRTQTCIIASSSVALLLVTLSLIHHTGMIFPLQVHVSATWWQ